MCCSSIPSGESCKLFSILKPLFNLRSVTPTLEVLTQKFPRIVKTLSTLWTCFRLWSCCVWLCCAGICHWNCPAGLQYSFGPITPVWDFTFTATQLSTKFLGLSTSRDICSAVSIVTCSQLEDSTGCQSQPSALLLPSKVDFRYTFLRIYCIAAYPCMTQVFERCLSMHDEATWICSCTPTTSCLVTTCVMRCCMTYVKVMNNSINNNNNEHNIKCYIIF